MTERIVHSGRFNTRRVLLIIAVLSMGISVALWPVAFWGMGRFVVQSLISILPLVIPGIALAAWIIASGADGHIAKAFEGRMLRAVLAASAIGAVTPVCGVTVLPLMVGLLAAGVPLAPVMAFWLSSPVTDPGMLATTAATLGVSFALGKTLAAFGLGILGGTVTAGFHGATWAQKPLRQNRIVGGLRSKRGGCGCEALEFRAMVWASAARRALFMRQILATTRLILICLIPAFAAEYALNAVLEPQTLSAYVGRDRIWAIPLAVLVGAPAYVDGYAALPLTRALMDHGMSDGAALAFLVSGGVVSIWGAMAIFPVLRLLPFLLYLALAVVGSLVAGYVFEAVM